MYVTLTDVLGLKDGICMAWDTLDSDSMDDMHDLEYCPAPDGYAYEIRSDGVVNRNGKRSQPLKAYMDNDKYKKVTLYKKGVAWKNAPVAKLVMMAFKLDEYTAGLAEGKTIDHINTNNEDNRVENLRMATLSQQNTNQDRSNNGNGLREPVDQLDKDENFIATHESISAAQRTLGIQSISKCLNGSQQTAGGFRWRHHVKETDADLPGEVWIADPNNMDYISNEGRFKRRRADGSFTNVIDGSQMSCWNKYPVITFGGKKRRLHIIIGNEFVPKPPDHTPKMILNHKDGDKTNAAASNLEWLTQAENSFDAYEKGLNPRRKPVWQLKDGLVIAKFPSGKAAAESDPSFRVCCISACINGKSASHRGFQFVHAS